MADAENPKAETGELILTMTCRRAEDEAGDPSLVFATDFAQGIRADEAVETLLQMANACYTTARRFWSLQTGLPEEAFARALKGELTQDEIESSAPDATP